MFERSATERTSLWKILPLVAITVVIVTILFVYLFQPQAAPREEITGVLRAGDPDYDWYNKYVTLTKPLVKMGRNFAGKRMVMFSGVIENGGERSLDAVEVKLLFFNADVPVWETRRVPIRPGSGAYTPPIRPLEKRGFTLYVEDVPGTWRASNAEMEVSGFRFKH